MTTQVTNSQVQTLTESAQYHEPSPHTDAEHIKMSSGCYGVGDRYGCTNAVSHSNHQASSKIKTDGGVGCSATNGLFDPTGMTTFDKEMIYSHPLFPLLNAAFEKCANATCTPRQTNCSVNVCSAISFNENILDFVKTINGPHGISDSSSAVENNSQLDTLLLQAIRVFRFHLLELDKVYELCDNFCHRYISCLKGKLPTELIADETSQSNIRPCTSIQSKDRPEEEYNRSTSADEFYNQHSAYAQNNSSTLNMCSPSLGSAFMNSGQPVSISYQNNCLQDSVDSLNNHFHNPYIQNDNLLNPTAKHDSRSKTGCNFYCPNPIEQVSDPIQHQPSVYYVPQPQITTEIQPNRASRQLSTDDSPAPKRAKYNNSPVVINQRSKHSSNNQSSEDNFGQDTAFNSTNPPDSNMRRRQKKRGIFPKVATNIMRSWLFANLNHPYPTEEQKKQLAHETGLTILQVNNWFINARRRIVQPMIDQTARAAHMPQNGISHVGIQNGQLSGQNMDYNEYLAAAVRYMPGSSDHHVNLTQSNAHQVSFNPTSSPATGFEVMAAAAAARAATYQQQPLILPNPTYYLDDNSITQALTMDDNFGAFRRFPQSHQHMNHSLHLSSMQPPSPVSNHNVVTTSAAASMAAAAAAAFYPPVMMGHSAAQYSSTSNSNATIYGGNANLMMPSHIHSPQPPMP